MGRFETFSSAPKYSIRMSGFGAKVAVNRRQQPRPQEMSVFGPNTIVKDVNFPVERNIRDRLIADTR